MSSEHDSIEALGEKSVPIEHNGKTATYLIREITEPELKKVSPTLKDGTPDKTKTSEANARLISIAAKREDGSAITFDQAQGWSLPMKLKLVKEIMDFNGMGKDAEKEAGEG